MSIDSLSSSYDLEQELSYSSIAPASSTIAALPSLREEIAKSCFSWASRLTDPICKISTWTHRILSPLHLVGRVGFCANKVCEIACRVLLSVAVAFLTVPAALSALLGIVVRCVGTKVRKNDFSYWSGKGQELTHLGDNPYKLKSWNVAFLAGSMCRSHAGVPEGEYRKKAIVEQIKQSNPDIVCLYEVQDTKLLHALMKDLDNDYTHFYGHLGTGAYKADSGILIASRLPIDDFSFTRFKDAEGSAKWINKGFASFRVMADGKPLDRIVTTHMQHDEHPRTFAETRNKQLAQIVDFLTEKHFKGEENLPKVFCGDVNIERNSPEYQNGFARYFENGYVGPEETRKNFTREIWNPNDTDPKVETIDVIGYMHRLGKTANYQKLVKPHLTVQLSHAYGDEKLERSDHHALDGILRRERQIKV